MACEMQDEEGAETVVWIESQAKAGVGSDCDDEFDDDEFDSDDDDCRGRLTAVTKTNVTPCVPPRHPFQTNAIKDFIIADGVGGLSALEGGSVWSRQLSLFKK